MSLVHVFLDDAPRAIARIHDLARKQDIAAIAAPAHTLKSTSANLGALVLSAQARGMELDARQGSLRDAEAKAAGLMAEFGRVAAELRRRIACPPRQPPRCRQRSGFMPGTTRSDATALRWKRDAGSGVGQQPLLPRRRRRPVAFERAFHRTPQIAGIQLRRQQGQ